MTTYTDLNAFQRDILWTLVAHEPIHGLGIKEEMESGDYDEVNHARLYPSLDTLVVNGLVDKSAFDKRTNHYRLTYDGREALQSRRVWELKQIGGSQ